MLVSSAFSAVGSTPADAATPAAPKPIFGMRPAAVGQTPLPGGHFTYSVPAGSTVTDAVVAENLTDEPLTLELFGADLVPLKGGGFGLTQLGAPTQQVGAWLRLSTSTVTLAPLQQESVPFTVQVPRDELSGDYGGAVVAQNSPSSKTGVALQFRVGLQVRIHVTGQNPHLAAQLGPISKHTSGRSMGFSATLTNTGNESFTFNGTVQLRQGSHNITLEMTPARDYLFPGQKVTLTAKWAHTPTWGSARAAATAVVTPAQGASLTVTGASVSMRFFPWWLVIMAILALLLLLVALLQTWRNRRELRRRLILAWRRRQAVRQFKGQLDVGVLE